MTDISCPQAGELRRKCCGITQTDPCVGCPDPTHRGGSFQMGEAPDRPEWRGRFGDEYTKRSPGDPEANLELFRRALDLDNRTHRSWRDIGTIVELGAGAGSNMQALRRLFPAALLSAVEINGNACEKMLAAGAVNRMYQESLLTWTPPHEYDLAFTRGVLIHIPAAELRRAYATLYKASRRYILVAEYYAPKRTEIEYRGRRDMLWKDDFAGEMMDIYQGLRLLDYGFYYHREPHPQDDITWFLMEKR